MKRKSTRRVLAVAAVLTLLATLRPVIAGETTMQKETKPAAETKPRFTIYGWIEGSLPTTPDSPEDNQNFGRPFDDPLKRSAAEPGGVCGGAHARFKRDRF